ncbi:DUF6233 domain-containing protein [Streptomyces sp. Tu 4128]|uniref:DUF6233 domain-containing protein n=1 Tax=Streptomyces sp. Tu 4128 TaxID=1120314 RepID=UPI0019D2D8C7|nr:DUF6233 domain-containing protein [Streptomyces sp. Tu 4128]
MWANFGAGSWSGDRPAPGLLRLRTLETFLVLLLEKVREAIKAREQREREKQYGREHRPPPPDWLLEVGVNRDSAPVQVHVGDCWNSGISQDEARHAIVEDVKPCGACQPESALGMLD